MEIINNTHIELTKIVKFKGEYYNAKCCFYVADIVRVEASRRFDTDVNCSKIVFEDEYFIHVNEKYKPLKALWMEWIKTNQDESKVLPAN
jgi:hypothetical protein